MFVFLVNSLFKTLINIFSCNLITFLIFKTIDLSIICKIYFDIIKEQTRKENIKKIEVQILALVVRLI